MTVKKIHQPTIQFLEENKDRKVSSILPQLVEMLSAKSNRSDGRVVILNTSGNVVAKRCYYSKRWCPFVGPQSVPFGEKKSTPDGYNTMSKWGLSQWTKQNAQFKRDSQTLLDKVVDGTLDVGDVEKERTRMEEERNRILPTDEGFGTKEECIQYLLDEGQELDPTFIGE